MTLLLAMARPLHAACTFYGGGMQQVFGSLDAIKCPVLGLFGDQDESIPVGTLRSLTACWARPASGMRSSSTPIRGMPSFATRMQLCTDLKQQTTPGGA
jgi:dienelactone hydrolase